MEMIWEKKNIRARGEIMGPEKYENVGKSQSVLIMINSIIFTRTRNIHMEKCQRNLRQCSMMNRPLIPGHTVLLTCRRP
jgi:hypothetical protein